MSGPVGTREQPEPAVGPRPIVHGGVVRSVRGRLREPGIVAAAGLLGAAALHLRDPHVGGSWGWCPFHAVTGWWCPGCGGLRALHDLTDLDLVAALSSNVLAVVAAAVLVVAWVGWARRRWRGVVDHDRMLVLSPVTGRVVLVVMAVFTIGRNLPPGAWLAP